MILKQAKDIAIEKCHLLQPYCDIVKIAGGIRRGKEDVHDIELVVLPKTEWIKIDLFGNEKEVRSTDFVNVVNKLGKIVKGNAEGKMMQVELDEKIMLDLFMADEINFGNIFLIRTGDWEFSKFFMGVVLKRNGYLSDGGYVKKDGQIISTPEEKILFNLTGIDFIKPESRNLITLKKQFYDNTIEKKSRPNI